jgi:hypothetical protein
VEARDVKERQGCGCGATVGAKALSKKSRARKEHPKAFHRDRCSSDAHLGVRIRSTILVADTNALLKKAEKHGCVVDPHCLNQGEKCIGALNVYIPNANIELCGTRCVSREGAWAGE